MEFSNIVSSVLDLANDAIMEIGDYKEGHFNRYGMVETDIPVDHKVILECTVGDKSTVRIEALMPPSLNLEIRGNWAQKDAMGLKDVSSVLGEKLLGASANSTTGGKLLRGFGILSSGVSHVADTLGLGGTTSKMLTAHYWQGASPASYGLAFEFIARNDPEKEVIQPIKEILKLAAPYEAGGVIIPPGPSVAGHLSGSGVNINIYVGSHFAFKNVIIESVSSEIDTRPSKNDAKILHAKVDVSFTSFFAITRKDIDEIFG